MKYQNTENAFGTFSPKNKSKLRLFNVFSISKADLILFADSASV